METALEGLYPGAVADWYAVQSGTATVTSFREFVERQTGMYRRVSELEDPQAQVRGQPAPLAVGGLVREEDVLGYLP